MNSHKGFKAALIFLALILLSGFALQGGAETPPGINGHWKRVGISKVYSDYLVKDEEQYFRRAFLDGSARVMYARETPAGTSMFETLYSWDIPKDRYVPGESIVIGISAEIGEYAFLKSDTTYTGAHSIAVSFKEAANEYMLSNQLGNDKKGWAGVSVYPEGEISVKSNSLKVSGKFPAGKKGDHLTIWVDITGHGGIEYKYEYIDEPASRVLEADAWWELVEVEILPVPDSPGIIHTISRGMATWVRKLDPWWGNKYAAFSQVSYYWEEPQQRYIPGEPIFLDISISLDRFDDPGNRLVTAGDWMDVGFMPGIRFTDKLGKAVIEVGGSMGKIEKGSDSLHASGIIRELPAPEMVIYVGTGGNGKVLYHYNWQHN